MKRLALLPGFDNSSRLVKKLSGVHSLLGENPHGGEHGIKALLQRVVRLFDVDLLLQLYDVHIHR